MTDIEVIAAWLAEVLVPDETTHMRPGAASLIARFNAAGLVVEDSGLRSDYLCLTTDVEVLQYRLTKADALAEATWEHIKSQSSHTEKALYKALTAYQGKGK